MHRIEKTGLIAVAMVACLFFSLGCEGGKKMPDPQAALEALAEQYWTKRLVDKDYEFTYDLELEKDSLSFSDYVSQVKRSEKFKVSSVKTKEVRIDGDRGEVFLTVTSTVPTLSKEVDMTLQDLWLLKSNQWKHQLLPKK
ncbi:MAG: hypothetical protein QG552_3321 [Thermodesulfobacteriota bacterium]|nr:hypothetical protein [Thermodesulfobacteriota bacterium]